MMAPCRQGDRFMTDQMEAVTEPLTPPDPGRACERNQHKRLVHHAPADCEMRWMVRAGQPAQGIGAQA